MKPRIIQLPDQDAKHIHRGKSKLLIYPNRLETDTTYLLTGEQPYGLLSPTNASRINLDTFKTLRRHHLMSLKTLEKQWPHNLYLYAHEYEYNPLKPELLTKDLEIFIKKMRKPFPHPLGKKLQTKIFLQNIPTHQTYVEPFSGGASLFFAKQPSKREILNDKSPVYSFMLKFLKNLTPEQAQKLDKMDWKPTLTKFNSLKSADPDDPTQKFYKYEYLAIHSYAARMKNFTERQNPHGSPRNLEEAHQRLRNATITAEDYEKTLSKYDGEDTFFYIDPPYYDEDIDGDPKKFKQELFQNLNNLKGKWLLSFSDDPLIKDLFKKFNVKTFTSTAQTPREYGVRRELLISNFPITIPITKSEDFNLEQIDASYVKNLDDAQLKDLYTQLHDLYEEQETINEPLLNASIVTETEMDKRGLKRNIYDRLSEQTRFWITEYPPPKVSDEKKETQPNTILKKDTILTLPIVLDSFPDQIQLPTNTIKTIYLVGGIANREWAGETNDIDIRISSEDNTRNETVEHELIKSCTNNQVREKLQFIWDTQGGIGLSIPLYYPNGEQFAKDRTLTIGKPSQPQKASEGEHRGFFWEVDDLWENWAAPRIERGIQVEIKFDGMAMQCHIKDQKVQGIFTEDQLRNRAEAFKQSTEELPKLLKENIKDIIFASEMVEYTDKEGWPENHNLWDKYEQLPREDMVKWIAAKPESLDDARIVFNVHNLLYLNGEDYAAKPSIERYKKLTEIIKNGKHWHVTEDWQTKDSKTFEQAVHNARYFPNSEGAILKTFDSTYKIEYDRPSHNIDVAKIKNLKTINVTVLNQQKIAGTTNTYRNECYIGPMQKQDLEKYRQEDLQEHKGKLYLRIGMSYNILGTVKQGGIIEVKPIRIRFYEKDDKTIITWMFPKVGKRQPDQHEPDTIERAQQISKLGTRPMDELLGKQEETILIKLAPCPYYDKDVCNLKHRVKIEEDDLWKEIQVEKLQYPLPCKLAKYYRCRRVKEYYYQPEGEKQ